MRHRTDYRNASYLDSVMEDRNSTIRKALITLKGRHFDSIAFRGLSGSLIAPILAYELGKTLLAVRKRKREGHSDRTVEGDYGARRYIIVDDFIQSGKTINTIIEAVHDFTDGEALCVGLYLTHEPAKGLRTINKATGKEL